VAPKEGSIWVDGCPAGALPLPDRGLDFGDGLFETLLLVRGEPLYLDLHLQRLQDGFRVLGFPNCLDEVTSQIHAVLKSRDFPGATTMRVTVTRGSGPRGYMPPATTMPRVIIVTHARAGESYAKLPAPARLALANIRWGCQPALAGIKHLNRLEQVMAAIECKSADADEMLMLDQEGSVISVSAGNLFIIDGDKLNTPRLDHCGVRGTRRRLILEQLAPALGLRAGEAALTVEHVESADEVFYCNALVGVRPVSSFAGRSWASHEVSAALHKLMCEGPA